MKPPIDASTSEATSAVYYATGQQQDAASIATTIGVHPTQVLPISTAMPVTGVGRPDVWWSSARTWRRRRPDDRSS